MDIFELTEPMTSEFNLDNVQDNIREIVEGILGFPGSMVSSSKTAHVNKYGEHITMFNSNVCTLSYGKVWYGDIDITVSGNKLIELADRLNENVYVLREMDARFGKESAPLFKESVVIASKSELKIIDKWLSKRVEYKNNAWYIKED